MQWQRRYAQYSWPCSGTRTRWWLQRGQSGTSLLAGTPPLPCRAAVLLHFWHSHARCAQYLLWPRTRNCSPWFLQRAQTGSLRPWSDLLAPSWARGGPNNSSHAWALRSATLAAYTFCRAAVLMHFWQSHSRYSQKFLWPWCGIRSPWLRQRVQRGVLVTRLWWWGYSSMSELFLSFVQREWAVHWKSKKQQQQSRCAYV